jgi:hypothetical protein
MAISIDLSDDVCTVSIGMGITPDTFQISFKLARHAPATEAFGSLADKSRRALKSY